MQRGTTVVASQGNASEDLSHPGIDTISPDFPPGQEQERDVTNACAVVPTEVPGVIGVTATGNRTGSAGRLPDHLKSFYSSYGVSTADVAAPGGDSIFGRTAERPTAGSLSTYPEAADCPAGREVVDPVDSRATYCYLQGTSMAGPHVAGRRTGDQPLRPGRR